MDDTKHVYFRLHNVKTQETMVVSGHWVMAHATRLMCDGQFCYEVPFKNWDAEAEMTHYQSIWVLEEKGKWKEVPVNLEEDEWTEETPHGAGLYYLAKGRSDEYRSILNNGWEQEKELHVIGPHHKYPDVLSHVLIALSGRYPADKLYSCACC